MSDFTKETVHSDSRVCCMMQPMVSLLHLIAVSQSHNACSVHHCKAAHMCQRSAATCSILIPADQTLHCQLPLKDADARMAPQQSNVAADIWHFCTYSAWNIPMAERQSVVKLDMSAGR